jgi:hypothetical protein
MPPQSRLQFVRSGGVAWSYSLLQGDLACGPSAAPAIPPKLRAAKFKFASFSKLVERMSNISNVLQQHFLLNKALCYSAIVIALAFANFAIALLNPSTSIASSFSAREPDRNWTQGSA